MTITLEQNDVNGFCICIEIAKGAKCLNVSAYPIIDERTCGYPITSLPYSDVTRAKKRFRTLCKRAERNEL